MGSLFHHCSWGLRRLSVVVRYLCEGRKAPSSRASAPIDVSRGVSDVPERRSGLSWRLQCHECNVTAQLGSLLLEVRDVLVGDRPEHLTSANLGGILDDSYSGDAGLFLL